jgi:peroxiredoxin
VSSSQSIKGKASPEFTFENHKGGTTKLSDLKGQYKYIDIWATWCAPADKKYHLQKIEKNTRARKLLL